MAELAVQRHNEALLANLERGDLIEFPRGYYSHWAVYIGTRHQNMVVHLAGDEDDGINARVDSGQLFNISGKRFDKASVQLEDFWDVVQGSRARKNNSKDRSNTPLPKAEVVKNALARIGPVEYSVLFHNCEHFAKWCRYGVGVSAQAEDVLTMGWTAVAGAALIAAISVLK